MPVNWVSYLAAAPICEAMGKRLPTEAEWEYAACNGHLETKFPWGNEGRDVCNKAILSRGRSPFATKLDEDHWCRANVDQGMVSQGPVAGGHESDVTNLGILNMAGNVQEWVADGFTPYASACWSSEEPVWVDPLCAPDTANPTAYMSTRGASSASMRIWTAAYVRVASPRDLGNPSVGVRCAHDM